MEVSTIEVIKRLVEMGLGVSLLPEMSVVEEAQEGTLAHGKNQRKEPHPPHGISLPARQVLFPGTDGLRGRSGRVRKVRDDPLASLALRKLGPKLSPAGPDPYFARST